MSVERVGLGHVQTEQEATCQAFWMMSVGCKARPLTLLLPTLPRSLSSVLYSLLELHSQVYHTANLLLAQLEQAESTDTEPKGEKD